MGRPTTEQAVHIEQRRAAALQLRLDGTSLADIGRRLHSSTGRDRGYTCELTNPGQLAAAAAKDIGAAIARTRADTADLAGQLTELHEGRLEQLWEHAEQLLVSNPEAGVPLALRVLERHARLRGLDAAGRLQLSGPGDQAVTLAFRELVADMRPAPADNLLG